MNMLSESKFFQQAHLVLIDGIAIGGLNVVRLQTLRERLQLPCIAVMRKLPDLAAIDNALKNFDDYQEKQCVLSELGEICTREGFVFQVAGCDVEDTAKALRA